MTPPSEDAITAAETDLRVIEDGELTIEVAPDDEACVVNIAGELDLGSAGTLETELQRLLSANLKRIVVNLERLTFLDSTGLRCLLKITRRSRASGDSVRMLGARGQVEQLFAITGARAALPLIEG